MNKTDKIMKHYEAHQKQLMKDNTKRRTQEIVDRSRLLALFRPLPSQQHEQATAPPLRPPMQGLLNDMNELDEQHAQVLKDMGTKHT